MSQSSITSFFKKLPNVKSTVLLKSDSSDNFTLKEKKRRRISSSDEDEPKKITTPSNSSSKSSKKCKQKNAFLKKVLLEENKNNDKSNNLDLDNNSHNVPNLAKHFDKNIHQKLDLQNIAFEEKTNAIMKSKNDAKTVTVKSAGQGLKGCDYNPSKKNYHPINDAFWQKEEKVPYLALARTFQFIEETSSRLKIVDILSNFFRSVIVLSPFNVLPSIYLCLNQLAPAYDGVELGVAETTLMKVIAQSTGRSLTQIKSQVDKTGDIGIVAEQSRCSQRMIFQPDPLTVEGVFNKLREISQMTGTSAMNKKINKIQSIFVACRHCEAKFFIRSLAGKLRIGLAEQSLLQALAVACTNTPPNQKMFPPKILRASENLSESVYQSLIDKNSFILKTTYCQCPNYNKIIPIVLEHGFTNLEELCAMEPSTPLKPMLAQPSKSISEVFARFEGMQFICEWKYDGERAQIHKSKNGIVRLYSRNQENNTSKYPDIISKIGNVSESECYILDAEVVAWNKETNQILPFQTLSKRKRKDVDEKEIEVSVCVYIFDLLYLNGNSLVKQPFMYRRKLLHENFKEIEGQFKFANALITSEFDEVQNFLEEAVKSNCEGLMIKTLEKEATYEIAKRSRNWLKLKKDYISETGVGDSLDLVVIGGFKGKGKRVGTYGGFLLACYDNKNEEYQSICKIGTGFSDNDLQHYTKLLQSHTLTEPKSYYVYDKSNKPDIWFEPMLVWEIKCADLSLSPVHKAAIGMIDNEKGISLRFPRFIRDREDKSPEDATSADQVAYMYSNQDQIINQDNTPNIAEDNFY